MTPDVSSKFQAADARLRRIRLRTRHPVEHLLAGEYRSVFKGGGMDFDELRLYDAGDDVRAIDWNVTARSGRVHVRRYVEERELAVWIVLDVSASCRPRGGAGAKADMQVETAALIAFSALHNHDRVGLILFSDRVERIVPPRRGRHHGSRVLAAMLEVEPAGRGTDPRPALDAVGHLIRRRALVFLLSDFLFDVEGVELARAGFRQDLIAIAVNDPGEMDPPDCGLAWIEDAESGERMLCDFSPEHREAYRGAFAARREQQRAALAAAGADFIEMDTLSDPVATLAEFFRHRLRRVAGEIGGTKSW
jgi:uncharacterized protein (DUF58 family)